MISVKEWLNNLANSNTSTESDNRKLENMLKRVGFPNAVVTCGIVYLSGSGQPESINYVARDLVKICEGK